MKAGELVTLLDASDEPSRVVRYLGITADGRIVVRDPSTGLIEVKATHWFIKETKNVSKKIT